MPTPAIRINGGSAGVKASVSASSTVTATLDSTDGVRSCSWSVIGTDETRTAASYTLTQSGSVGQTVTFTSGAAGTAGILRVEINGGQDLQTEQASDATRATCKWYVATAGGAEVGCVNETVESSATYGWTGLVNYAIRNVGGTSRTYQWQKYAADAADGAATIERPFAATDATLTVNSVGYYPDSALTADNTNYATISVYKADGGGGASTLVASANTKITGTGATGDWLALTIVGFTLNSTPTIANGDILTVAITKSGAGVTVPAGVLFVACTVTS